MTIPRTRPEFAGAAAREGLLLGSQFGQRQREYRAELPVLDQVVDRGQDDGSWQENSAPYVRGPLQAATA